MLAEFSASIKPLILGTTTDEGSFMVPVTQHGPDRETIKAITLKGILGPHVEVTRSV